MAYSASNPPKLLVPRIGDGHGLWIYVSADARATVEGANYFSNGLDLGMKVNDAVIVVVSSSGATTIHAVTESSADGATINAAVLA